LRILIAGQYFTPEVTACAARLHGFASGLARRGHQVEVVSEVPSHPEGVVAPGYGGKLVDRRAMDGFHVNYVWVRTTTSKETRARLWNYATYAISATIAGALRGSVDAIVASSPPLTVGSAGAALAIRHRAPWILDVRDLWPDVALMVEQVGEGRMVSAARRLERRLYASARTITTVTEAFKHEIEDRGGAGKTELLRNGAADEFLRAGELPRDPSAIGGSERVFTWTYAGNLGLAQGLESAIEAARMLGDGFRLLLVGEGPRRDALRELAASLPPGQVELRPPVPPAEAAVIMRASDALLVSLAAMPGLEAFVPSKLFDCCAVGRPVVLAAEGEVVRLAEDAVLAAPPGDAESLAAAVRGLRDGGSQAEQLAARGRSFAEAHSRERGVERLEELLMEMAPGR
jgi:glycosyltransferase involved in cell wall biosynthesis